jgi:hypothetical protein
VACLRGDLATTAGCFSAATSMVALLGRADFEAFSDIYKFRERSRFMKCIDWRASQGKELYKQQRNWVNIIKLTKETAPEANRPSRIMSLLAKQTKVFATSTVTT